MKLQKLLSSMSCCVILSMLATANSAAQLASVPETDQPVLEYGDVASAFKALSEKQGVKWHSENGWAIAIDEAERAVWSFAPPSYPAYPAVVKRYVTAEGNGSTVHMAVRCEAEKDECDELVRTFAEMNGIPLAD